MPREDTFHRALFLSRYVVLEQTILGADRNKKVDVFTCVVIYLI